MAAGEADAADVEELVWLSCRGPPYLVVDDADMADLAVVEEDAVGRMELLVWVFGHAVLGSPKLPQWHV